MFCVLHSYPVRALGAVASEVKSPLRIYLCRDRCRPSNKTGKERGYASNLVRHEDFHGVAFC